MSPRGRDDQAWTGGTTADAAVEELRIVGGKRTLEGQELTAGAAAAGLRVRWLDLAGAEAQAAIAAQGPGAIRMPLVIVDSTLILQRPRFSAVDEAIRRAAR